MRYEKQYRKKAVNIFEQQRKEALSALGQHSSGLKKDFNLFDRSDYDTKLIDATMPVLTDLANVQGGLSMRFAGDSGNEFILTAPMQDILRSSTARMAQSVNARTLERLNQTLAEGLSNGEGIPKLRERVNEVYDSLNGYRSELIARTETLKASNSATIWAYKQTGYVVGKKWVINPGACELCASMDGRTVSLDDNYLNLGESVQDYPIQYEAINTPPLHPNCRCTVVPTTSLGSSPVEIGDSGTKSGATVYRGEGNNIGPGGGLMLGNTFYVSRDASIASQFGTVHQIHMPLTTKDILYITTDKEFEDFILAAQRWGLANMTGADINDIIPAYILSRGYKAAEISPGVDPLGGIGIADPKVIQLMSAQMDD